MTRNSVAKWVFIVIAAGCVFMSGCGYLEEPMARASIEDRPWTSDLPRNYYDVRINESTSAEVLENLPRDDVETLSQSESVIGVWGVRKNDYQRWASVVAFDEESLVARRKYFVHSDEKSYHIGAEDQKLFFDAVVEVDETILNEPYPSANARLIAIFEHVFTVYKDDMRELTDDSQSLQSGGLLVRQTCNSILNTLRASPGIAYKLTEDQGMAFEHTNLGSGRVRMVIDYTTVKLRIKVGYKPWGFTQGLDMSDM